MTTFSAASKSRNVVATSSFESFAARRSTQTSSHRQGNDTAMTEACLSSWLASRPWYSSS